MSLVQDFYSFSALAMDLVLLNCVFKTNVGNNSLNSDFNLPFSQKFDKFNDHSKEMAEA